MNRSDLCERIVARLPLSMADVAGMIGALTHAAAYALTQGKVVPVHRFRQMAIEKHSVLPVANELGQSLPRFYLWSTLLHAPKFLSPPYSLQLCLSSLNPSSVAKRNPCFLGLAVTVLYPFALCVPQQLLNATTARSEPYCSRNHISFNAIPPIYVWKPLR